MTELCQKLPVVFEIDTEKNRYAEYKLPVGYWIRIMKADNAAGGKAFTTAKALWGNMRRAQ
jgi:hypothetical protein